MSIESVGSKFNLEKYLNAREFAIKATREVASKVEVGMNESDGQQIITSVLENYGVERLWHPSKFRIGSDTVKVFRERPDQSIKLSSNDLFFVDIGPVFEGHEADYGETFALGTSYQLMAEDCKKVFGEVASLWKTQKFTGTKLYQRAYKIAETYGYTMADQTGHRLGDYPHALYFKGHLADIDIAPAPHLWILEIHLLKDGRGAFFEDILA